MPEDQYIRKGKVIKVQDGDSVFCEIDMGFSCFTKVELRLLDVFAFESKGSEKELGIADKEALEKVLPEGTFVTIQTFKTRTGKQKMSFTRYIAKIWLENGELLNDLLKVKPQGGIGANKKK